MVCSHAEYCTSVAINRKSKIWMLAVAAALFPILQRPLTAHKFRTLYKMFSYQKFVFRHVYAVCRRSKQLTFVKSRNSK